MAQTRLDRIEKSLELLIKGIDGLKESQKKTDEQIGNSQKKTDEQIGELKNAQLKTDEQIGELKNAQLKTDEQIGNSQKKTDEQIGELKNAQLKTDEQLLELKAAQLKTDEQIANSQKKTDEHLLELKAAQLKTDKQIGNSQKKTDEQILELKTAQKETALQVKKTSDTLDRTIIKLDRVGKQLADMGIVQGEIAEDLFYRNVKNLFRRRDMVLGDIQRNIIKLGHEYDIVAADSGHVLVLEVKNKLNKRAIDQFVKMKLPKFRESFPEYRNRRLLGGIGSLIVSDDLGKYAENAGLFVMTQTDEGGAALLNRKNFVPKNFA